jgi:hypothetical protein
MKERPILFSAPMVRAILDGSKTQTRRVVKLPVEPDPDFTGGWKIIHKAVTLAIGVYARTLGRADPRDPVICPYGQPGDRLWVREAVADIGARLTYRADTDDGAHCMVKRWTPSIHMPRWASRILLEIVSVRVERLHDISTEDICAEGLSTTMREFDAECDLHEQWRQLWESINGAENYDSNPWVWVIEFKRVLP